MKKSPLAIAFRSRSVPSWMTFRHIPTWRCAERLAVFVKKQTGLWWQHALIASTTIERDLGVTGIEADEFMEAFFREFDVESGNYDGGRYFGPEGLELGLSFVGRWLDRGRGVKRRPKQELTPGMLQRAIDLGIWDSTRITLQPRWS